MKYFHSEFSYFYLFLHFHILFRKIIFYLELIFIFNNLMKNKFWFYKIIFILFS